MRFLIFSILFISSLCHVANSQPINDECWGAIPLSLTLNVAQKFSIADATKSDTNQFYSYYAKPFVNPSTRHYDHIDGFRGYDAWFVFPNVYGDLDFFTDLYPQRGSGQFHIVTYFGTCDSLTENYDQIGHCRKKYPKVYIRIIVKKLYGNDSVSFKFFRFGNPVLRITKPNIVMGAPTQASQWIGNQKPKANDSILINRKTRFTGGMYASHHVRVGKPDSNFRCSWTEWALENVPADIYNYDTILVKDRCGFILMGDFENYGFVGPQNSTADSLVFELRGGYHQKVKGNDPMLRFRRTMPGGEVRYTGVLDCRFSGKVDWPWPIRVRDMFLGRGEIAGPPGDSIHVNYLIRINGTEGSPIKPVSWQGKPFRIWYPQGKLFGQWDTDINWRSTPEFWYFLKNPSTPVLLDKLDWTREERPTVLFCDTSIWGNSIVYNSPLVTRVQDTVHVSHGKWIRLGNGVVDYHPGLPDSTGQSYQIYAILTRGTSPINGTGFRMHNGEGTPLGNRRVFLQYVEVTGDLSTGSSFGGVGVRIDCSDPNFPLKGINMAVGEAGLKDTVPQGTYGVFQSHTPSGPWKRLMGDSIVYSSSSGTPQYLFHQVSNGVSLVDSYKGNATIADGKYLAFMKGTSRHDLSALNLLMPRKAMLDGHSQAPPRRIGLAYINYGKVAASTGSRLGMQVDGGQIVFSSYQLPSIPLNPYQMTNPLPTWSTCIDTLWAGDNQLLTFSEPRVYKIKAWLENALDSSRCNDTLTYTLDLLPKPVDGYGKFTLGMGPELTHPYGMNASNTWSYTFANSNKGGNHQVLNISPFLVAQSPALDASTYRASTSNWLYERFLPMAVAGGFNDAFLAMGFGGQTQTIPEDNYRMVTSHLIGPIGENPQLTLMGSHARIPSPTSTPVYTPMRSTDTVYVETSADNGISWTILRKIVNNDLSTSIAYTTFSNPVPYPAGSYVRMRVRYNAKYDPLMTPPFPNGYFLLGDLELSSDAVGTETKPGSQEPELVKVYPNPAEKTIHIHYGGYSTPDLIELYDLTGKRMEVPITGQEQDYDISLENVQGGIYLVRVSDKSKTIVKKIIKLN